MIEHPLTNELMTRGFAHLTPRNYGPSVTRRENSHGNNLYLDVRSFKGYPDPGPYVHYDEFKGTMLLSTRPEHLKILADLGLQLPDVSIDVGYVPKRLAIKKRQRVTYSSPIDRYPDGRKDWAKAINDFRQDIILRHNGGEDVEVYLRPLQTVSMHYKSTHFPAFNEKLRGREYIFPLPQEFQSRSINAVLQKKGAAATVLLRPSQPQRPERDSLLRPAAASSTNARQLLRPSEEVQVGPSQTRWQKIKERAARLNPFKKRR